MIITIKATKDVSNEYDSSNIVLINKIINFAIESQHHIHTTLPQRTYTQRIAQQNLEDSSKSKHVLKGSKPNSQNIKHQIEIWYFFY